MQTRTGFTPVYGISFQTVFDQATWMNPRISAVIPTYNRSLYLRKAIASLCVQTLAQEQYEILVVDNASTDNTKQIVLEEFGQVPNLQYLYEPLPGLNSARNTGWKNAKGEYIAYIDDDAIVSQNWLEYILDAWNSCPPNTGCVGGPVEPIWEIPRPEWLSPKFDLAITIVDWGQNPYILRDTEYLVGANIAFPRGLLESVGGFRFGVDRTGNKLFSGGEIVLQTRLQSIGYRRFYHPGIAVKHHLSASRLTQRWFVRRRYWEGVSDALSRIEGGISLSARVHLSLYKIKQFLIEPKNLFYLCLPSQDPDRFFAKCNAFGTLGYIAGLLHLSS